MKKKMYLVSLKRVDNVLLTVEDFTKAAAETSAKEIWKRQHAIPRVLTVVELK